MLNKNSNNPNNNTFKVPKALAERIARVADAKKEFIKCNNITDKKDCIAYREWGNAGYSIYNDRG